MLPAKFTEPWEVLEIDFQDMGTTSSSGNRYRLLIVDKASRFLLAYPTKPKECDAVANYIMDLCLIFGIPACVRSDRGGEFTAEIVNHVCRWLKVEINYGPADHPRGQGAVERAGAWIHDALSELCKQWPRRWDKYAKVACWIKRTMPDPALPNHLTPFQLLFGRKPRTQLDALVPQVDGGIDEGGLNNFVERQRQTFREVKNALAVRHESRHGYQSSKHWKASPRSNWIYSTHSGIYTRRGARMNICSPNAKDAADKTRSAYFQLEQTSTGHSS